ncbi:hypothetical protein DL93DRAFT_2234133 [Clavulina sp. PMI_390]|nr:hypothetical protein DL93DRAFT_2234133 [Clavulina sp. PMI_390]
MSVQVEPIEDFNQYKELVDSGDTIVLAFCIPVTPEASRLLSILTREADRANSHGAEVKLFEVDPFRLKEIADDCNVKRTPAVVAFKDCKESGRVTGFNPQEIEEMMRKLY